MGTKLAYRCSMVFVLVGAGLTAAGCALSGVELCNRGSAMMCRSVIEDSRSVDDQVEAWKGMERICTAGVDPREKGAACIEAARLLATVPRPGEMYGEEIRRRIGNPDPARAAALLRPWCEADLPDKEACQLLAGLYWAGFGVPRDRARGREYAREAAEGFARFYAGYGKQPEPVGPGDELLLVGEALERLSADGFRSQLLAEARSRSKSGDVEGAVDPFLTLLSLFPRDYRFQKTETAHAARELADKLWEPAVSAEIAKGRIGVGVGRAAFIARQFPGDALLAMNLGEAKASAARSLAAQPEGNSPSGKAFRTALANSLSRAGSDEAGALESASEKKTRMLPRWRISVDAAECAWLVERADAAVAGRPGAPLEVPLTEVSCSRTDGRWTTTESYKTWELVSAGNPGHKERRRTSHWAECPGYSKLHDMCSVEQEEEVVVGATEATYRDVQAIREVQHRLVSWSMFGRARMNGEAVEWRYAGARPEQTWRPGDSPQPFPWPELPEVEKNAGKDLVAMLDRATEKRTQRAAQADSAPKVGAEQQEEGPLFEYAGQGGDDDGKLRAVLARYGMLKWHFRALAVRGSGGPMWLYGLDDAPLK